MYLRESDTAKAFARRVRGYFFLEVGQNQDLVRGSFAA